jgi:hypothetical protein
MELKVGDKVRFLNEKGGGIVTRLVSTSMVQVAIEEGFEVPVMVSDLIKIDPEGAADRFFDRPVNVKARIANSTENTAEPTRKATEEVKEPETSDPVSSLYRQSGAGLADGMYLIWEPQDQKWLITGNLDIYLVNNSEYEAIFSFMLEEENGSYAGVSYEVVPAYSKFHIETITREDLEAWSNGIVQVLFYAHEMHELLQPLHAHFKIKPSRFFKDTGYHDFKLTGSKAIILHLGDIASQRINAGDHYNKMNIDPAAKQKIDVITPTALIDKHRTGPREAEVDLHISALRTDYSTMPQNEILLYQVDYFTNMLDSAIAFNYRRVIFIHGIGNGVLKSAIINKLKDYEHIELRKAPFAHYGNGAIEIAIHTDNRV